MEQPILAGKDFARLAPRTYIHRRNGQAFQVRISEPLMEEYRSTKQRLYLLTAKNPSQTIVMRRALDLYIKQFAKLSDEQVRDEVRVLMKHR